MGMGSVDRSTAARSDLGQGLRIAIPQIAGRGTRHRLSKKIRSYRGRYRAHAPTRDEPPARPASSAGGMQIRQAAATARKAFIDLAAQRLKPEAGGPHRHRRAEVRPEGWRRPALVFASLLGRSPVQPQSSIPTHRFKDSRELHDRRQIACRGPTVGGPNGLGTAAYVHDFALPGMQHGPRGSGRRRSAPRSFRFDEDSVKSLPGVKVVRINSFLAVCRRRRMDRRGAAARELARAMEARASVLPAQDKLVETLRTGPGITDQTIVTKGDAGLAAAAKHQDGGRQLFSGRCKSHASLGPVLARWPTLRARRGHGCGPHPRARMTIAPPLPASLACPRTRCA